MVFEDINKINKPLDRLIRKTRKKAQIINIRNERGNISEVKNVIRKYHKSLHANKLDNLGEMDSFLQRHKLPRLSQEEIDKLNYPILFFQLNLKVRTFPSQKSYI